MHAHPMLPSWDNLISICLSWICSRLLLLCLWPSALPLSVKDSEARPGWTGRLRTGGAGCRASLSLFWPTSSKSCMPEAVASGPHRSAPVTARMRTLCVYMCTHARTNVSTPCAFMYLCKTGTTWAEMCWRLCVCFVFLSSSGPTAGSNEAADGNRQ